MNTRDVEPRYLLMKAQIADTYDLIRGHLERHETFFFGVFRTFLPAPRLPPHTT